MMLVLFLVITCFIALEKQMIEIKSLLYDKHVHFDPKIDKLVDLAVDHWRLKKHIEKVKPQLSPEDTKRIDNSLRRVENYLHENDIEVSDYTGRSANYGINVDVISIERDSSIKKPIIKETIVPDLKDNVLSIRRTLGLYALKSIKDIIIMTKLTRRFKY